MSESSPAAVAAPALPLRAFPDLLRLLSARVATTIANQMLMLALGWQMYDLTGSAWQLGLVGLAQFVPALVFALPAGHLVDRHDRRRTLLLALGIQSLVAALLALGSLQGWLGAPVILGVSMLLGVADRKSTRLNSSHSQQSRMPSSA